MNDDRRLIGTGFTQQATGHRQTNAQERLEALESYALKAQTHVWVVLLTHKASEEMLDAQDDADPTNVPILDVDSLVGGIVLVCYVCESIYDRSLRHRKCKGEPR